MQHYEQNGFVSVWAGNLNSRLEFDDFLQERIGDDDRIETPLNKFAESVGVGFCDHDFQEAEYSEVGAVPIRNALFGFSYSSSFINKVQSAAEMVGAENVNTVILLYDFEYKGRVKANSPVLFVGAFGYEMDAPVASK